MDNSETRTGGRRLQGLGRRIPAAGWVAVGLLGAAIIAPASAVAASNLVGIVGSNGARAGVNSAGQLQTAATSPGNFVARYGFSNGSSVCKAVYTVPKGDGLIIRSVTFNTVFASATGPGDFMGLYASKSCSGLYFLDENPGGTGEVTVPLDPGVALKSGTTISLFAGSALDTEVYIDGYLVPAKAVPSNRLPAVSMHVSSAQHR